MFCRNFGPLITDLGGRSSSPLYHVHPVPVDFSDFSHLNSPHELTNRYCPSELLILLAHMAFYW